MPDYDRRFIAPQHRDHDLRALSAEVARRDREERAGHREASTPELQSAAKAFVAQLMKDQQAALDAERAPQSSQLEDDGRL